MHGSISDRDGEVFPSTFLHAGRPVHLTLPLYDRSLWKPTASSLPTAFQRTYPPGTWRGAEPIQALNPTHPTADDPGCTLPGPRTTAGREKAYFTTTGNSIFPLRWKLQAIAMSSTRCCPDKTRNLSLYSKHPHQKGR